MNVFVSDGVRLAYRVDGSHDVPAIVLVNSLGTDLRMWDPQIALGKVIQVQNQETSSGMRGIPRILSCCCTRLHSDTTDTRDTNLIVGTLVYY
jgi:hypothetical protein